MKRKHHQKNLFIIIAPIAAIILTIIGLCFLDMEAPASAVEQTITLTPQS